MIVTVKGFGNVNFPDSMSEAEVKQVLNQFNKPKDDRPLQALQSITEAIKSQKPAIVTEQKIVQIEKPIIDKPIVITDTRTEIVEIEKPVKPTKWKFTINKIDDERTEIYAESL